MTPQTPNLYPETHMFSGAHPTAQGALQQMGYYAHKYGNSCRLQIDPTPPNHDKAQWTWSIWVDFPDPRDVARSYGLPRDQWPARERSFPDPSVTRQLEERM